MITATHNPYSLSMVYAGYKRVGTWWNYKNVISPFYRLYYVEGERAGSMSATPVTNSRRARCF